MIKTEYEPGETKIWRIESLGIDITLGQTVEVPKHSIPNKKRARLLNIVGSNFHSLYQYLFFWHLMVYTASERNK